jgi:NhaA family Na+:H+ antiporter
MADSIFISPQAFLDSDRALARYLGKPVAGFLAIEASGGILLIGSTIVALIWANVAPVSYVNFWETSIHITIGNFAIGGDHLDLQAFVNDALMTVFFFVVGLEIKREMVSGELRDRRVAALPAIAALGGMIVPALVYLALNVGGSGQDGWGIPMATDIAFALGVVALLGSRVPAPLKVFLLTLAIVDDIGAILVIALFYTSDLSLGWLLIGVASIALMFALRTLRVWYVPVYALIGVFGWMAFLESGVHATIAGVIMGLITPAKALMSENQAEGVVDMLENKDDITASQVRVASFRIQESVSVAERLEWALHPWTSFVIVPIFALANAGIILTSESIDAATSSTITLGVLLGLVVGKTVGVGAFSLVAVKMGICDLPRRVTGLHMVGVSMIAGIGFTVSLFITELAFDDVLLKEQAKLGVLAASVVAAIVGAALLVVAGRRQPVDDASDPTDPLSDRVEAEPLTT